MSSRFFGIPGRALRRSAKKTPVLTPILGSLVMQNKVTRVIAPTRSSLHVCSPNMPGDWSSIAANVSWARAKSRSTRSRTADVRGNVRRRRSLPEQSRSVHGCVKRNACGLARSPSFRARGGLGVRPLKKTQKPGVPCATCPLWSVRRMPRPLFNLVVVVQSMSSVLITPLPPPTKV